MNFKILLSDTFQKNFKQLAKKHSSLKSDLLKLIDSLEINPSQGTPLGNNLFKIRLAITSTGKGKSGGARVITLVKVVNQEVFLITIYSKTDRESISKEELDKLAKDL
ncbi:type II toxin-antitoxin system RelE/ParE family toxin [Algoriphagus aquatilis]|uniref:Type II toxin-antitoxin system RelE/ParE family toxin n=1 Tax=Algoriphagus aquatilis TaxID=490186 RepID=A0ABW0BVP3_9BACT|nr:type II toxin-antitoxin system RelE/ParE family toxin [Algoriphagus sp.]